jgi:hypothetical protein
MTFKKAIISSICMLVIVWIGNRLQAQTSCRDTVFNVTYTEHICLPEILGEWSLDSIADKTGSLVPFTGTSIWTFYENAVTMDIANGVRKIKGSGNCVFKKGYMEINNYQEEGMKELTPRRYKVISITRSRLVIEVVVKGQTNRRWQVFYRRN